MFCFSVKKAPEIQLVKSPNPYEGLPQIKFGDVWGAICHLYSNYEEASAICRQLGYTGYNAEKTSKEDLQKFGTSLQPIKWLDQINCADDAARVDLCNHDPVGSNTCRDRADSLGGVICDGTYHR